jgi:ABC-2 type transport system permease protein
VRTLAGRAGAELARVFADRAVLASMVLAVLAYSVFYPQPYLAESLRDVPVVVVDQDGSTASRELARRIDATEGALVAARAPDMEAARRVFLERRVSGIVLVPPLFERDLLAGRPAAVALYGDGGYFLLFRRAAAAVTAAARSIGVEAEVGRLVAGGLDPPVARGAVEPLRATLVPLFNPQAGYASYVVPAALVLILQQTLLMGVGMLWVGRRPRAPAAELGGSLLAYAALYSLHLVYYLAVLARWYDIPRLGRIGDMLLFGLPFILATSLLAVIVAALARSREAVLLFLVVLGLPFFFLSGVPWPYEAVPGVVRWLALPVPSSTAIDGMVRINQMGAGLGEVRRQWLTLWALCAAYGAAALWLYGRRSIHNPACPRTPRPVVS